MSTLSTLIYISVVSLVISCGSLYIARIITKRQAHVPADDLNAQILRLIAQSLASNWSPNATVERRATELMNSRAQDEFEPQQHELLEWLLEISAWPDEVEAADDATEEQIQESGEASSDPLRLVAPQAAVETVEDTSSFLAEYGVEESMEQATEVFELSNDLQDSRDPDRRAQAAIKLGQLGDPFGVPYLVESLRNDGEAQVRTFSAVALGMIGSRDAIRPLIEVINDHVTSRYDTREDISYGGFQLIRALQREIDPEPEDWLGQDPVAAQIWALGRIGSSWACDTLVERLSDGDPGIRWFATWALGKIGDTRVVPALTALIDDPVDDVRWIAIWALGRMNASEAVSELVVAASDRNPSIRRIAIWALGRSGHLRGREVAMDALTDPERGVRQVASWALSQIEPEFAKSA